MRNRTFEQRIEQLEHVLTALVAGVDRLGRVLPPEASEVAAFQLLDLSLAVERAKQVLR